VTVAASSAATGPGPQAIVERLVTERPAFHSGGGQDRIWNAQPRTLELIARFARPGWRTLETGAGASTAVFAAAGARHVAISPAADEHRRIREWCEGAGIDCREVEFVEGFSDEVLPSLDQAGNLDMAFIDGGHSFPIPVVDWHYVARRLRVGGILLMDDIPIPAVAVVFRAMMDDPGWVLLELADHRAAVFRKSAERPEGDVWRAQAFNRAFPDYSFASRSTRLRLQAHHRVREFRRDAATRHPRLTHTYRVLKRRTG
jgi:predicted O-methyltransferase YrrM